VKIEIGANIMTIGERISFLFEKKNIQVEDFAVMVGAKEKDIAEWKNGNYNPTIEQIIKISDYLNVSTDWILKGDK